MRSDTRHSPPRRGRWLAAGLGLLTAVALASCAGDDGANGTNGKDGTSPQLPIKQGQPLPGFNVSILAVEGGSGPAGQLQVGDKIRLRFTVKDDAGKDLPKEKWDRARVYVGGPSFNYQQVIASLSDVAANATVDANGVLTYEFTTAMPDNYLNPLNYTGLYPDGVLAGQPLLAGTYTVAFEGRMIYELEDGSTVRDTGNVTADFLFGNATAIDERAVVGAENCYKCHVEFRAHGGNRKELKGCLLCHTSGAQDRDDPEVAVDFRIMIHKIHSGHSLPSVLGMTTNTDGTRKYDETPKPFVVGGNDYSHVGYPLWPNFAQPMPRDVGYGGLPADARAKEDAQRGGPVHCDSCHGDPDGDGPIEAPAQGDLIYSQPSRFACQSCHDDWVLDRPYISNGLQMPANVANSTCIQCHPAEGNPIAVKTAHHHPLLNEALATGVDVEIASVTDGSPVDGGTSAIDPGDRIQLTVNVRGRNGVAIDASTLPRIELTVSGPTTNPNTVHVFAVPPAKFAGQTQPYTLFVPMSVWLENVGTATAVGGETFPGTLFTPHWNITGAATTVQIRSASAGASTALVAPAEPYQNYVDIVAQSTPSTFARNAYIVIADGVSGAEEYQRIQWVEELSDRWRLWFSSIYSANYPASLRKPHASGTQVSVVSLTSKTEGTDYTLDPQTGAVTELTEFGANNKVLVTYVTDLRMPSVYPGTLNDSPDLGADVGDWGGLPIVPGTYKVNISAEKTFDVSSFGEITTYIDGSKPAATSFLVGSATQIEEVHRIDSPDACYSCHGDIQFHGSHRRGFETCAQCHTVAGAEDRPRYVAANAPPTTGTMIDFRSMLHKIHHGRNLSQGANYIVNGFGSGYPNNYTAHTYENVGYPVFVGETANCASCHGAQNDAWKEPAERNHPTAMNALPARSWTVACTSCHDSSAARAHADVNTSRYGAESCAICHGAGKELAVELMHYVR